MRTYREKDFEFLLKDVFEEVEKQIDAGKISLNDKDITKEIFEIIRDNSNLLDRYVNLLWNIGRDSVNPIIGRRIREKYDLENDGEIDAVVKIEDVILRSCKDKRARKMIVSITEHHK